ncbi:MAG: SURF1 family protein [Actinobacteria bacterium]|nr:SURF1 family protein [Actinomycetota bacterium]
MTPSPGRLVGLALGALVVSVSCVFLGLWQWGRYEDRVAAVEQVEANWDAEVISVDDLVADGLTVQPGSQWRTVAVTGRFLPESTVLLRNRPVSATPALHVLGILLADRDDGGAVAVVVQRGWVPADATEIPPLPSGEVEIVVRVRPEEGHLDRRPPPGQVYTLNTAQVVRAAGVALDMPVVQGYGQVVDAEPPLRGLPEPDRDLGPHLSYAFQWWFFAAAVPVGVVILARRERDEEPRPRTRPADEVAEDILVDAQVRQASEISSE